MKIDKKVLSNSINYEELGIFKSFDTKEGLQYLGGNRKLYLKILNNFYYKYKDLKLENLDNETVKIALHTIKGLSGNIGAKKLNKATKELEIRQNRELFSKFHNELDKILSELKEKLNLSSSVIVNNKESIDLIKRERLFNTLKEYASKKRPRQCSQILEQLNKYKLLNKDEELIINIKSLLDERKYRQVVEIL